MSRNPKGGFTLIELLVVVMIIGILARVAVPQYFKVIEKDKAVEGVSLFRSLKAAQDRYMAKYGVFCNAAAASCSGFDVTPPVLHYFVNPVGAFTTGTGGTNQTWSLTLTRANTPALYGAYQMTYDVEPNGVYSLKCSQSNCQADLLPGQ